VDKPQVVALYDQDQRREVEYPDMRREVTARLVRHVDTSGTREGAVIFSQLSAADAGEAIREQIAYFEGLKQNFEWKVYDYDEPADLKDRLAAFGFVVEEAEAIMVVDLANAPEIPSQPSALEVRRITNPAGIADVRAVLGSVWDEDTTWLETHLGGALRRYPEQMSVYVAYDGDQPASAAWTYFPRHSQFASLWGGATRTEFRKHGFYTALLARRAQEARSRQVRYLTVDASEMSRPILEKFGFECIAISHPCKWKLKTDAAATT